MINFIRKYWKHFTIGLILVFIMVGSFFYDDNSITTSEAKKLSVTKKEVKDEDNKSTYQENNKTVFVDVKGAVNTPGVYEIDSSKRIIDAINLAGGLASSANTINLNLSKKVEDEMYIVVYNTKQIEDYKNGDTNNISCAAKECVCPDSLNKACISSSTNSSSKTSTTKSKTSSKISINTALKEELMTLSGIGETKALAIIKYREENGAFKSIQDIKNVSGIGNSLYEKIKDNITL